MCKLWHLHLCKNPQKHQQQYVQKKIGSNILISIEMSKIFRRIVGNPNFWYISDVYLV